MHSQDIDLSVIDHSDDPVGGCVWKKLLLRRWMQHVGVAYPWIVGFLTGFIPDIISTQFKDGVELRIIKYIQRSSVTSLHVCVMFVIFLFVINFLRVVNVVHGLHLLIEDGVCYWTDFVASLRFTLSSVDSSITRWTYGASPAVYLLTCCFTYMDVILLEYFIIFPKRNTARYLA